MSSVPSSSEIKFTAPKNPTKDGKRQFAYLTVEEFDRVVELIDASPGVVEDLKAYSKLVNKWRNSDDPLIETWTPESLPQIREMVISATGRDDTGRLVVFVYSDYLKINGWVY
jgi:hypothetical protein